MIPAIEAQGLVTDPRWPSYKERLEHRREACVRRLSTHEGLDHSQMARLAGEIRGLDFALGTPADLSVSDPRSNA